MRGGGSRADLARPHVGGAHARCPVPASHIEEARYAGREGERFQTAAWLDPSHPSILKDDRWEDVKFYQAIHVGARQRARGRQTDATRRRC